MWSKVTTSSAECLDWIEKGVMQLFNFNHTEAILNFHKALTFDKDCAMAHYFIAYCNAGHYNFINGMDYAAGWEEASKALTMAKHSSLTDWETALIEAQIHRFCFPIGSIPIQTLNKNYANKMRLVYHKFEGVVEVAAFFAESLMNLAPWELWTPLPDIKPAIAETEELVEVIEKGLKLAPNHPGLCHFYIHTLELSSTPLKALPAAEVLRNNSGRYGHLFHMASHIDIWSGNYKEAIEVNKRAIKVDEEFLMSREDRYDFYNLYCLHNYHFVVWAAMFCGQYSIAMKHAEEVVSRIGPNVIAVKIGDIPFGKFYIEPFRSIDWHVLVRFGKWKDIINRPINASEELYPSSLITARYARSVAFAALGMHAEAETERSLFYEVRKDKTMSKRYLVHNVMYDPDKPGEGVLDVAECVMNGEIEYHKGNFKEAFQHLRLAVKRDSNLVYGEPWSWMVPSRHALGALLIEREESIEAESVYREDLLQYKDNMWSLLGLHQALKMQQKIEEAGEVLALFEKASAFTEFEIGASCLCATGMCS